MHVGYPSTFQSRAGMAFSHARFFMYLFASRIILE
ncbi:hypothetical protein THPR109532_14885 [Thalassospira profundimaris]